MTFVQRKYNRKVYLDFREEACIRYLMQEIVRNVNFWP